MEWSYLYKMLIATALGIAIGFERKLRFKEAGLRTHSIVSLGACLMMIISVDAFNGGDQGRVAAQIVSGIGFLGAGMIMFKRQSGIHGLTTAAGIWVTAGVGMAIGAGMYILGIGAAVFMILIQCFLHLPFKVLKTKRYIQLKIVFENVDGESEKVKELFEVKTFSKVKAVKEDDKIILTTVLITDKIFNVDFINNAIKENEFIKSIERIEDE